eukprot:403373081
MLGLAVVAKDFNQTLFRLQETSFTCEKCEIQNAVNNKTVGLVIKSKKSSIQISNSKIQNILALSGALIFTLDDKKNQDEQVQVSISNCIIQNLSANGNGGAVYVSNQQLSIKSTKFMSNYASSSGGSIYIACDITAACMNSNLTDNSFTKSKALVSGGGIQYELNQPINLISQSYSENEASYGKDYASYPTKLKILNTDKEFLHSLVSGQNIENYILIGLFDQNDQLISKDSESIAQIFSNDLAISISGNTKVAAQKGIFTFDQLNFLAKPSYLSKIYFSTESIDISMASFTNQIQSCLQMPQQISMLVIINYLNLCRGGIESQCSEGYHGLLCSKCTGVSNDTIYGSTGLGDCSKCNSLIQNPKRNNPQAVMIRIMTNYIQAVFLAKQFNLRWPQNVEDMLTYFSYASSSQEALLSFDCIYLQLGYQSVSQNELKLILFGMLPVILSLIGTFIWTIIKITIMRKDKNFSLMEKIEITAMIVNYLCYPQIITMMFSLFDCYKLDYSISYLKRDMDIICWKDHHNKLIISIGLPFIFVWTLLVPILLIKKIHGARKNLEDKRILKIYGLYYIGLKNEVFYWELIVANLRKLLFIMCSTILATQKAQFRIFTLFGGLFFLEDEIQNNDTFLMFLFFMILSYNLFFLSLWIYSFSY